MGKRRKNEDSAAGGMVGKIVPDLIPLAVEIGSLVLDPDNCRKHGPASIASIKASLERFSQRKPIVVNAETNVVTAGNGTVMAARELGWTHIAAVRVQEDPSTARGWAIADNRTAELSEWDLDALLEAREEIDPELAELLLLDDLLSIEPPADETVDVEVPKKYSVLIECADEQQQREVFERLRAGGFPPAKVLTI